MASAVEVTFKALRAVTITHPLVGKTPLALDPASSPSTVSVPPSQSLLNNLLIPLTVEQHQLDLTPLLFGGSVESEILSITSSSSLAPAVDFADWTTCAVSLAGAETVAVPKNLVLRVSVEVLSDDRKFILVEFTQSGSKRVYLGRELQEEFLARGSFQRLRMSLNFGPGALPPKLTPAQESKWLADKEEESRKLHKSLESENSEFEFDKKTKLVFKITEHPKIDLLPHAPEIFASQIVGQPEISQTQTGQDISDPALAVVEAEYKGEQIQADGSSLPDDAEISAAAERLFLGRDFVDGASLVSALTMRDATTLIRTALELEFRGEISRARAYYQQAARLDASLVPAVAAFLARNRLPFLKEAISAYTENSTAATVALVVALGRDGRLDEARDVAVSSSLLLLSVFECVHGNSNLAAKYLALYTRTEDVAVTADVIGNFLNNGESRAVAETLKHMHTEISDIPEALLEFAFRAEATEGNAERALEIFARIVTPGNLQALATEMRAKRGDAIGNPEDPYLCLKLAEGALEHGNLDETRRLLEISLASYPTAYGHELMFQTYEASDDAVEARRQLQSAVEIDSESAVLWLELVKADIKLKRLSQARQSLGSFIKRYLSPSDLTGNEKIKTEDLVDLVGQLNGAGLFKEAEVLLDLLKVKYGGSYELQFLTGDSLNGQRRLYDALHAYEAATTLISPPDKKKLAALQAKCTPISTRLRNRDETTAMHQTFRASR